MVNALIIVLNIIINNPNSVINVLRHVFLVFHLHNVYLVFPHIFYYLMDNKIVAYYNVLQIMSILSILKQTQVSAKNVRSHVYLAKKLQLIVLYVSMVIIYMLKKMVSKIYVFKTVLRFYQKILIITSLLHLNVLPVCSHANNVYLKQNV